MNFRVPRAVVLSVLLVLVALAAGCAKKAAETPRRLLPLRRWRPNPRRRHRRPLTRRRHLRRRARSSRPATSSPCSSTSTPTRSASDGRSALDKDARLLREHTHVNITVEGHCDERGTAEYNQALGEKRAPDGTGLPGERRHRGLAAPDHLVREGTTVRSRTRRGGLGEEPPRPLRHPVRGFRARGGRVGGSRLARRARDVGAAPRRRRSRCAPGLHAPSS